MSSKALIAGLCIGLSMIACSKKTSKTSPQKEGVQMTIPAKLESASMQEKVNYLLNSDNTDQDTSNDFNPALFDEVVPALEKQNDPKSKQELVQLYLKHGIWNMYYGPYTATAKMRLAVTVALKDFIRVLELDPHNQEATRQINQIIDVYKTMPNKSVPEEVVPDLKKLGFLQ